MRNRILHIMVADKIFTLPLIQFMEGKDEFKNHFFLVRDEGLDFNFDSKFVYRIRTPFRSFFIRNLFVFISAVFASSKIILHGLPMLNIFILFPFKWKNISWVIYGADLYDRLENSSCSTLQKVIIKYIGRHITHIEGDSILANRVFKSKAKFHYSPMYLSNVVDVTGFSPSIDVKDDFVLLIGNSVSKNNNHIEILRKISRHSNSIKSIICPLSYGNELAYRDQVVEVGKSLFGDKFTPLVDFMALEDYVKLLNNVDIAIFDHWRQQAMGVTLSLLSLGKTVYMRKGTESYNSLVNRGFKVFDNQIVFNEGIFTQDVTKNKELLEKFYSSKSLSDSLTSL